MTRNFLRAEINVPVDLLLAIVAGAIGVVIGLIYEPSDVVYMHPKPLRQWVAACRAERARCIAASSTPADLAWCDFNADSCLGSRTTP
jgi:hypothetical protein